MQRPLLDLNLIPVLQALVAHKSVTRAAHALGISQPQASRALARLREQTGDPLLTRIAGGMEPTDTALRLKSVFDTALDAAFGLLEAQRAFDARVARTIYRLSMKDYESALVLPGIYRRLTERAAFTQLAVLSHNPGDIPPALESGQIELAVGRFPRPSGGLRAKVLFEDGFTAFARQGHPLSTGKPSIERLIEYPHVLVSPGGAGDFAGFVDRVLKEDRLQRRVQLSVTQFLVAPLAVSGTDSVVVLPSRLGPLAAATGLRPLAVRLKVPRFQISMLWRDRNHREPRHRWLRELVEESCRALKT
jgi:DNA-binding transcriptional LysR family regulator